MVASILIDYDYDKSMDVYGFGGIPPGAKSVSHCFALNGNQNNPTVTGGLEPLLTLYRDTLEKIEFSGPTKFEHILNNFETKIIHQTEPKQYNVLLILTDGCILDMS